MKRRINLSLKQRIYLSFLLLVFMFVLNGIVTLFTMKSNKKIAVQIFKVIAPSIQALDDFDKMMLESKMYTTNWVFLRASQEDKKLLKKLHDPGYAALKSRINLHFSQLADSNWIDSLNGVYTGFEELLVIERDIMNALKEFKDYDNPVIKLEAERKVEEEIIPRTISLMNSLDAIQDYSVRIRSAQSVKLESSSMKLRILVIFLTITIILAGFLLSIYMTRVIIAPVNRIRHIIDNLGKGITQKISQRVKADEIGKMILSVNNLSEKLEATAAFAQEVGRRNFDIPFKPLSSEDTLGKSLIAMRDNIKSSDEKLNEAQHIAHLGSWERNIETDEVALTDEMYNIFDIDPSSFDFQFQSILKLVHPDDIENVTDIIRKNRYRAPFPIECKIVTSKGITKDILVETKMRHGKEGALEKTFGIVLEITERKKAEANLELQNKELERKNKELEQFAYVASHDLQEPLRTTLSFVKLFQQQYKGKLDDKADKYLNYITQSSGRMEVLIKDLLDYSRIGHKKELQKVDCNKILQNVLADLDTAIQETQADIQAGPLPVINGYPTEVKQLFQNLIANAIKFRKKDTIPEIRISVQSKNGYWEFEIKDNGIGFDEQHSERIFIIFQRLHTRTEYKGSGIGLSHCKKIVELHNGKIWVESSLGNGSTFYFTIPEKTKSNIYEKLPDTVSYKL